MSELQASASGARHTLPLRDTSDLRMHVNVRRQIVDFQRDEADADVGNVEDYVRLLQRQHRGQQGTARR